MALYHAGISSTLPRENAVSKPDGLRKLQIPLGVSAAGHGKGAVFRQFAQRPDKRGRPFELEVAGRKADNNGAGRDTEFFPRGFSFLPEKG